MVPMTTTMNALRASARSTPPAPVSGPVRTTRTATQMPRPRAAPLAPTPTQPERRPPSSGGDGRAAEEGEDEDEHEDHQSCSSLELVEIEIAELGPQALGQHHEHDHAQEDVEGDAQLDQEGDAGGAQEGDQGDPVVDQQQPDHLEDGPAPATRTKKPRSRVATPTGTSPPWCSHEGGHAPGGGEGQHDEHGGGDQRGRDVDQGPAFPGEGPATGPR